MLIILADQLGSASDQASAMRQSLYREATGEFSMPLHLMSPLPRWYMSAVLAGHGASVVLPIS